MMSTRILASGRQERLEVVDTRGSRSSRRARCRLASVANCRSRHSSSVTTATIRGERHGLTARAHLDASPLKSQTPPLPWLLVPMEISVRPLSFT